MFSAARLEFGLRFVVLLAGLPIALLLIVEINPPLNCLSPSISCLNHTFSIFLAFFLSLYWMAGMVWLFSFKSKLLNYLVILQGILSCAWICCVGLDASAGGGVLLPFKTRDWYVMRDIAVTCIYLLPAINLFISLIMTFMVLKNLRDE